MQLANPDSVGSCGGLADLLQTAGIGHRTHYTIAGAGAEGEVYAAWWRDSMVAVKRFNRAADSIHELRMHTAVGTAGNDDCIVPLRGYCRRDNAVYLVMEYCPRSGFWGHH